jgi:hypothetical protein
MAATHTQQTMLEQCFLCVRSDATQDWVAVEGAPCADEGATYTPKTDVTATPGTGDQATYNNGRKPA